ncbi:1-acyl-sn-glycerol-3-phosphate acyltransferase [Flavobacterium psychrophilum]|uniref:1-acyl-sn-glycerol-3-phosphate acyltransferase n=1 Tax=Flavobacterium psychrophilum TaxID=96345 RepID=UPI000B7C505D|nr:1-acyl-sn-glycerol-3-phosphate acyltransferase [Flavobacterium psychrophilum]EKT4497743.1 1-acyl-sn-glycerol-3-phosphate acyltransferase [Flavobacterium psychrophilum]ELM3650176.1 1-acyl-sn-glycerol-3-phosphate acyltransferase [Flavobacterium psychrophilum]ELM3670685.1 1-acyl-sn-glycerol-3-phosphate acyltransferase [Flavobacterium psychrophilum]ELM3725185.1 1-acyl-sn-glycerol-3-phosphate acyltransferase [Flavobacterium psychrophilum]ELY1978601.1 1-acyl-sn-glycerol-3-phosphate acyltransferas
MKRTIYKLIFFKLMGWKIKGFIAPEIKKCVMITVPHTSNHDFYLGIFTRGITGLEMNFVAKKELFKFPFGTYFRWMGGEPLDRTGGLNKVDAIANIFAKREIFRLAIAPEGTRKKVAEWKTGFYYIAMKANVPIIPVVFNFGDKEVKLCEPFYLTGNIESDIKILEQNYIGVLGKIPENSFVPNSDFTHSKF